MSKPTRFLSGGAGLSAFAVFTAMSMLVVPAQAQRIERQGKDVVDAVCSGCHVAGKDNAPRIGDARAWSARASRGLTDLTDSAVQGIRKMPPHGGNAGVSDIEIERAITYMVNRSGGQWVEPLGGATPAMMRASESIVRGQCATCHETGRNGAPKIGDTAAWIPRLKRGLDRLVASAVHGHGPMPSRGGWSDLSDAEIRGAIVYMFNFGVPASAPPPAVSAADPRHRMIAGTDIYLGMMRAESMRSAYAGARGSDRPDIPSGKGYYHVNISLADSRSHAPVTDAEVTVRVSDGMTSETHTLDLVPLYNTISYGGFYRFASGTAYDVTARVRRPGVPGTIEAKFDFKAP